MRYIIVILLSSLLVSCGLSIENVAVPASVQPYAAAFESMHGVVRGIQWEFDNLPSPVIGRCTLPDGIIELDNTYWASASDTQREETVTHELGHCILYRAHLNTLDANGNPVSLMNAYLLDATLYSDNRVYYLNELFNFSNVPMLTGVVEHTVYDN